MQVWKGGQGASVGWGQACSRRVCRVGWRGGCMAVPHTTEPGAMHSGPGVYQGGLQGGMEGRAHGCAAHHRTRCLGAPSVPFSTRAAGYKWRLWAPHATGAAEDLNFSCCLIDVCTQARVAGDGLRRTVQVY